MNSLSWMIYAADIVVSLSALFCVGGLIGAVASLVLIITSVVPWFRWSWEKDDAWNEKMALRAKMGKAGRILLPISFAAVLVSAVIPSRNTIYLIAASEAGGTMITSPEAKEVFDDLKSIIKSKLKEQLPKT